VLLRCIGMAVVVKGPRALACQIPFGEVLYDIAEEAYRRLKESGQEEEQTAGIAAAAGATAEEARREAEAAVGEIAATQPLSREAQINLVSYLSQVPSVVRQTLKRPSDPTGRTVPSSFTLKKPEQVLTLLPQRLPTLKAGDRIANWELVELLGAGGFGEVWLARHPSLHGLTAALKFCLDPTAASTLRHEAKLLARVMAHGKHPGIVPLRQVYQLEQERLCLEYEYVNGGDLTALLAEWQRGGKVPRQQVNRLVLRLAEIVAHAHQIDPPIVHRDLKPANILVERSPGNKVQIRITDFGIGGIAAAQSLQATRRGTTSWGQQLSTSLRGSHTPNYASPQQVRGAPPDPRDDVHALGVIWYQLLVGDLTTGIPAEWKERLQKLGQPAPLIRLLGACVDSRPEERLASATVLVEKLTSEVEERVLEAIPVDAPPRPVGAVPFDGGRAEREEERRRTAQEEERLRRQRAEEERRRAAQEEEERRDRERHREQRRLVGTWRGVFWLFGVQTVIVISYRADGTYSTTATPQVLFAQSISDAGRWTYEGGTLTASSPLGTWRSAITWFGEDQFRATVVWSSDPTAMGLEASYTRVN
jgi:hypothetical protein